MVENIVGRQWCLVSMDLENILQKEAVMLLRLAKQWRRFGSGRIDLLERNAFQKELVGYIFRASDSHEQLVRVGEIFTAIDTLWWRNPNKRVEIGQGRNRLCSRIAEEAFHSGQLMLFARLFQAAHNRFRSDGTYERSPAQNFARIMEIAAQPWGPNDDPPPEVSPGRSAYDFLLPELFRKAGENLERSMQCGLFLLEQLSTLIRDSLEEKKILDQVAEKMEEEHPGHMACSLILASTQSSPNQTLPLNAWIENLLRASISGNTAVDQVLEGILFVCGYWQAELGGWQVITPVSESAGMLLALTREKGGPSPFYVSADLRPGFDRWIEERGLESNHERKRDEEFWREFDARRDRLEALTEAKRRAVIERPRRGLRPRGADHVEIRLQSLCRFGIRSIAFYPDGCEFPNVKIRVVTHKGTPHLFTQEGELKDLRLQLSRTVTESNQYPDMGKRRAGLLEFVIIDILYRIVVEGRELQRKVRPAQLGGQVIDLQSKEVPVRPHIRKLPAGHRASETASNAAQVDCGWRLRPGETFVRAFFRGNQFEYDLPTEPVAIYGDEDLFEKGEWS